MHEARIGAARAAQADPATKALLHRHSKVERKIDHLQNLGMRQARYRGRRTTRLQALLAATVANSSASASSARSTPLPNWPSPPEDGGLTPFVGAEPAIWRRIDLSWLISATPSDHQP